MYYFLYDNINDAFHGARDVGKGKGKIFRSEIVGYRGKWVAIVRTNKKPQAWTKVAKIFEPVIKRSWEGRKEITRMKAFKHGYTEDENIENLTRI